MELYINGILWDTMPVKPLLSLSGFTDRVEAMEEHVKAHVLKMKSIFHRPISRAEEYQIFLAVKSKPRKSFADEYHDLETEKS